MKCPRPIDLIQAAGGDLGEEEKQRIEAHAGVCPGCAARLKAVQEARRDFLVRHPFERAAPAIIQASRRRLRRSRLVFCLAPAAAAALLLVVLAFWALKPAPPATRTKGDVSLAFYVKQGEQAIHGRDGGVYLANDRIQFTYSSGSSRYLFLVSLDERGRISNFNHRGSRQSVRIVPGNDRVLEGSIILDDAVGPERIFAIFSDRPLQEDRVTRAAQRAYRKMRRAGGSVRDIESLPLDYPQASVLLMKQ